MMPHAIRRVYVARRARTAASVAIALFGSALLVIAAKPAWAAFLATGLPGINPAVLCTLIIAMWIVGSFAYLAARAFDEHRFAVAMTQLVMPGADVIADVERLSHENPDQAARDMAHRLEVRSAALPVLAAGVLLPVTALYAGAIYRTGGWPQIAEFEAAVAIHAKMLLACAAVGGVLAIAMTKRAARLPAVAPVAMGVAIMAALLAPIATLWLVPITMLLATVALVVRRLRIERNLLQAEDPAAGSEIFTIRGFFKQLRASLAPIATRIRSVRPVWALVTGLLVIASFTAIRFFQVQTSTKTPMQAAIAASATQLPVPDFGPTGSMWRVTPGTGGTFRIDLHLVGDRPIHIPALGGIPYVPAGWKAHITVVSEEGLPLEVSPVAGESTTIVESAGTTLELKSCGLTEAPFGLRVHGKPGHYVLHVKPELVPADC